MSGASILPPAPDRLPIPRCSRPMSANAPRACSANTSAPGSSPGAVRCGGCSATTSARRRRRSSSATARTANPPWSPGHRRQYSRSISAIRRIWRCWPSRPDRDVGIDIEYRHRDISIAPFARHILCENEAAALQRLPAERHKQALLTVWTRKEAYVKALGEGLARSLKSFSAGIADDETAVRRLEDANGEPQPGSSPRSPCTPIISPAWRPRAATGRRAASTGGRYCEHRPMRRFHRTCISHASSH